MLSPALAALALLQAQPHAPTPPRPLSPFARAKAEALLRDHLPCLGCHELHGQGGRIGPSLSDVTTRRDRAYIARMIADPQGTVPGTVMPRLPLDDGTWRLLVGYLTSTAPDTLAARPAPLPPRPTTADTNGAVLYGRHCVDCHGVAGAGDGSNARYLPVRPASLGTGEYLSGRPDDALYDAIAGGGAIMGRSPRMPAFGGSLAPTQITALVRYLRALCRCQGPAWSLDGGAGSGKP
jgi:mono/diheme cytochrome c family protein